MAPAPVLQSAGNQLLRGRVLGQPSRSPSLNVSHSRGRSTARRAARNVASPQRGSAGENERRELSPKPVGLGSSAPRSASPTRPASIDSRNVSAAATSSVQAQVTDRIAGVWGAYTARLESDPIRTKALTSFMGFVIGDTLAQRIGGDPIDALRCLRLGAYGLFLDGPIGHLWYKVLDKNVMPDNPRSNKAVLIKTAADQLVWAPLMTVVFFAVLKTLEGHPELIWVTVQDKLVKTVVANYILWPGAHWINFKYVPTQHRILYNNCVSIIWSVYLSLSVHGFIGLGDPCKLVPTTWGELVPYVYCLAELKK
ncbi:hypothetical protein WJX73_009459 [Symbiochloris irregularis]|uniref:Uncharacterized protein n=1 Tax=Symbiochloris irregularis TaxID=706552 RepID=A0AAW1PEN1_9CHLO